MLFVVLDGFVDEQADVAVVVGRCTRSARAPRGGTFELFMQIARNVARDLHKEFESSASWRTRASRATPDYDRYVGLLIDEAVEYNKQHPKTYNLEEAKVEVRRRIAEKLADREL